MSETMWFTNNGQETSGFPTSRLLCFPHAGGNGSLYRDWKIPNIEVIIINLPGHGLTQNRFFLCFTYEKHANSFIFLCLSWTISKFQICSRSSSYRAAHWQSCRVTRRAWNRFQQIWFELKCQFWFKQMWCNIVKIVQKYCSRASFAIFILNSR